MNGELVQIGKKQAPKKAGDSTPRLVLTLGLAGLLSGLAIVGAYEITRPMIEANEARALRKAVFEVVPEAARLEAFEWRDGQFVQAGDDASGDAVIYAGYGENGVFRGWAIPNAGSGYQDTIALLYGFDPAARSVTGMEVLASRETPGLGDRIYKDESFVGAFRDLPLGPEGDIELVTDGASEPWQVDGITGATISSQAVVRIINDGNERWLERLPAAGQEPPLEASEAGDHP